MSSRETYTGDLPVVKGPVPVWRWSGRHCCGKDVGCVDVIDVVEKIFFIIILFFGYEHMPPAVVASQRSLSGHNHTSFQPLEIGTTQVIIFKHHTICSSISCLFLAPQPRCQNSHNSQKQHEEQQHARQRSSQGGTQASTSLHSQPGAKRHRSSTPIAVSLPHLFVVHSLTPARSQSLFKHIYSGY